LLADIDVVFDVVAEKHNALTIHCAVVGADVKPAVIYTVLAGEDHVDWSAIGVSEGGERDSQ
jgi:hypothetical protein